MTFRERYLSSWWLRKVCAAPTGQSRQLSSYLNRGVRGSPELDHIIPRTSPSSGGCVLVCLCVCSLAGVGVGVGVGGCSALP